MAIGTSIISLRRQVVTISGESGAGKTESAKLFIKMIVNCAKGSEFVGLEEKLLKMNPILESFGNAKTAMVSQGLSFMASSRIHCPAVVVFHQP